MAVTVVERFKVNVGAVKPPPPREEKSGGCREVARGGSTIQSNCVSLFSHERLTLEKTAFQLLTSISLGSARLPTSFARN